MPQQVRPFTFDTVFDGDAVIAPVRPQRAFTPEEVQAVRAGAYAEGQASAIARAEADASTALGQIAQATAEALSRLATAVHEHRAASAELALAAARGIADAALDHCPQAPINAALESLALEIEAAPRLTVQVPPALEERLGSTLAGLMERIGYAGALIVRADSALKGAAFGLDWGDGRARFDPQASAARIATAIATALAADAPTVQGAAG